MLPRLKRSTVSWGLALACIGLAMVWLTGPRPDRERQSMFRGLTAREWARELRNWTEESVRHVTFWARKPSLLESALEMVGVRTGFDERRLVLLEGDPEAVPVLIELLQSPDAKVRRVAAQGLFFVGPEAKAAVPALLTALSDVDDEVRLEVEQALGRVDPDTATAAGVRPHFFDLRPVSNPGGNSSTE